MAATSPHDLNIPPTRAVDGTSMRAVLGSFATGVVAVTAAGADGPVGMTVNSFTSLSLDPPLVLFCPLKASSTWPAIERAGHFCANVLAADQLTVSTVMAARGVDRFAGLTHGAAATGAPVLDGALAWIDCTIDRVVDGGDHLVVIGRVQALGSRAGEPLVVWRGRYGRFADPA